MTSKNQTAESGASQVPIPFPWEARLDIAEYFDIPNERITILQQIGDCVWFTFGGSHYSARMTKTNRIRKNSIRLA